MNFILVLPDGWGSESGSQNSWNAGRCCAPATNNSIDDLTFVRTIVDSISKRYAIDSTRVWSVGFSNGGMMAYRLACEMSETFTAIGVGGGALVVDTCSPPLSVSVIHIHGNLDDSIPLDGGGQFKVPPVINSFKLVNSANTCFSMPYEVISTPVSETTGAVCSDGTEAKLINYFDQGHDWTVAWSKEIIKFLFAHPRK